MEINTWLLFAFAITLAPVLPGPNVLIVIVKTISYGSKGAIWTILGNLACLFCIALLASFGVGAANATAPIVLQIMKIAGGLYLGWLGYNMIRSSFGRLQSLHLNGNGKDNRPFEGWKLFTEAFLVSASNPKAILILTAVFAQFLNTEQAVLPQFGIMFATIIGLVTIVHGIYATLALKIRDRPVSQRARAWLARLTGSTFVALGAGMAISI